MTIFDDLGGRLKGRVLVVGAGNPLRGDDGAGPRLVEMLTGKVNAALLDVGEIPEAYTRRILETRADTILFVDAADFGAQPGDFALLEEETIAAGHAGTHQLPLTLFFQYLRESGGGEIVVLGIQPQSISLGTPMSAAVSRTLASLSDLLKELLK
ncbi:hydrogenase 3 maturation endopeptidase HyCI [Rhodospirillum rubrum]|uniref:Peptidase M52, hydrogen uptake protein n=1 Tax=Rhodospirillum rubrum (strain ATCC 11170 / ATH 1.1.1 / DSM 467 / LMG 4362 / NCIMB 8255 / S1) TaxID=269796 RepID=Q2RXL8_RHORT|nr:hydrogenase 3 maturation endopeptidase HyCI [Rhodospirillum rubrum]ABC21127.1 Peptidase M52, hydrogen uptake protein [Rhodospirillum rubrum ATCC 11170]AEO46795.1 peptidase M52, hydrogen uptake protein [Rhodospirillum rubrum F11]MBK5952674.1 hydrogenase 3 maturation endopeptidase HyCI [Rhodospirillum rubrum]QXG80819.1 hydrogenase 3 maturation endopeptidase HyCI [Rhodospirillum rubrum]HAP98572.1 hydrogenase 3 maturation endopeptidase HyCI [Rhodospirillum rubrum]